LKCTANPHILQYTIVDTLQVVGREIPEMNLGRVGHGGLLEGEARRSSTGKVAAHCLMNTTQQGRQFQHYYAHYLSYYSNYFDSLLLIEMDTKRCSAGAAGSTNFPCVACIEGSCRKTLIDDWSSAVCQVSSLLFALFYFYFNYFSSYTRYFKSRKWDSLQNHDRAPLEGAEAA
jgi:hypothetical protein